MTKKMALRLASYLAPEGVQVEQVQLGKEKKARGVKGSTKRKGKQPLKVENDPPQMLDMFKTAVKKNAQIKNKVKLRRFEFVKLLENAEMYTDKEHPDYKAKDFSASIDARTTITWDKIVERMVAYCKAHNFDSDESTCILVCQTLTNHVRRVRSDEAGTEIQVDDLDDDQLEEYKAKQTNLDKLGVTLMALEAVATHKAGVEGSYGEQALELLQ